MIAVGKYSQNIVRDAWLSSVLGKEAYRIIVDESFIEAAGLVNFHKLCPGAFFYAKVLVHEMAVVQFLQKQDFRLIDTNVVFEKQVERQKGDFQMASIRMAQPLDRDGVKALAGSCFNYSRFHLDPQISVDTANKIKTEWAGNFFSGKRGAAMIVAENKGELVGFLQLLDDNRGTMTIDLIGVKASCRREGIAAAMINFAQASFSQMKTMTVGTQVANTASVRCYEKLGFRLAKAFYIFHYHA